MTESLERKELVKNFERTIEKWFQNNELKYTNIDESNYWFRAAFEDDNGTDTLYVGFDNETEILQVFCLSDKKVPSSYRNKVSEFFIRLNYRLTIGGFQLDWGDGEIRFACVVDTEDIEYSESALDRIIRLALSMIEKYTPYIMKVIYANLSPEEVYQLIFGGNESGEDNNADADDDDDIFDTGSGYVDFDSEDD